jgi:hypothetical protein
MTSGRERRDDRLKHTRGLRTFYGYRHQNVAEIGRYGVVGDRELLELRENGAARLWFRIQEYLVGKAEDIRIRDHAPLGIEEERVATGAREQRSNIIRCQRVDQARAVRTADRNFPALRQIQPRCAFDQRSVSPRHGASA